MITATRTHEIACGHRVYGHESKCSQLHGHNYRFELTVAADELDALGRVIDFGVIKSLLCGWLEDHWDHKTLLWTQDPLWMTMKQWALTLTGREQSQALSAVVCLPVNPTAENIAAHFGADVAPALLAGTVVRCVKVVVWETSKCSAAWVAENNPLED